MTPSHISCGETEFLAQLPAIRAAVRAVCRRHRVPADDEAELAGAVILKLIDNDYAVFRQCREPKGLRAFLFTVAYRCLLDMRNRQWGKWRPSRRARRLGSAAVFLEALMTRDGMAPDDARATLARHPRWNMTAGEGDRLQAQLPSRRRCRRRGQPIDTAIEEAVDRRQAGLAAADVRCQAARVREMLGGALSTLDSEERRLLRLRFQEGRSIADIASVTAADPQRLYRRFDRILRRLRAQLLAGRLTSSDVRPLLNGGFHGCHGGV